MEYRGDDQSYLVRHVTVWSVLEFAARQDSHSQKYDANNDRRNDHAHHFATEV